MNSFNSDDTNLNKRPRKPGSRNSPKGSASLSDSEKTILINELEVHQLELAMQNQELNITRENLETAVEKYTELYDSAPTGYMSLSKEGKIVELNLCAAKMLGMERQKLTGSNLGIFFAAGSRQTFSNFLSGIFKNENQDSAELVLSTAEKNIITVYIIGHLSKNNDHCDISMIDITERKKADELLKQLLNELTLANKKIELQIEEKKAHEAELIKTNKELEHAFYLNNEKTRFISILAHDLRSPFSVMLGYSEMLLERIHELNEGEVEKLVKEIQGSTHSTFALLENLLKWARLQTGKVPFKQQNLKFVNVFDEVMKYIIPLAETKKISLNAAIPQDIEIFADPDMLMAVLRNLLSNAVKFSHPDAVVKVNAEQTDSNFIFSVTDNGVGINSQKLPKLFDIDRNQTVAGTAGEKGTGLGLFLSKGFVEKHGGKLWVESVVGRGSIFYFNIPTKGKISAIAAPPPLPNETRLRKLKILIVDDNDSLRMILGEIVKKFSKDVLFASNGIEALSAMKNNPDTDLILMDFFMPEMNGYEATKQIRMINNNVVIFVETADTLSDVKTEFDGARINDFFQNHITNITSANC